jgi:hypothetical protein
MTRLFATSGLSDARRVSVSEPKRTGIAIICPPSGGKIEPT